MREIVYPCCTPLAARTCNANNLFRCLDRSYRLEIHTSNTRNSQVRWRSLLDRYGPKICSAIPSCHQHQPIRPDPKRGVNKTISTETSKCSPAPERRLICRSDRNKNEMSSNFCSRWSRMRWCRAIWTCACLRKTKRTDHGEI
jgi:hypothetical protein